MNAQKCNDSNGEISPNFPPFGIRSMPDIRCSATQQGKDDKVSNRKTVRNTPCSASTCPVVLLSTGQTNKKKAPVTQVLEYAFGSPSIQTFPR